jgi:hypothetical protein
MNYIKILFCIILFNSCFEAVISQTGDSTLINHIKTDSLKADSVRLAHINSTDPFDDFSPGMAFISLVAFCLILVSVGAGIVLTIAAITVVFGMVTFGIASASLIVGLNKKSFTKGFKTFLVLILSIGGFLVGMILLYISNRIFHLQFSRSNILTIGGLSGLIGGFILGFIAFRIFQKLTELFRRKLNLN